MAVDYPAIMREHFDEIVDKMIDMDVQNRPYQMDLYLYPDGTMYEFVNVGGNSWLDDEHCVVWKINNQFSERDGMSEDEIRDTCNEFRDTYEMWLNIAIDEQERSR